MNGNMAPFMAKVWQKYGENMVILWQLSEKKEV